MRRPTDTLPRTPLNPGGGPSPAARRLRREVADALRPPVEDDATAEDDALTLRGHDGSEVPASEAAPDDGRCEHLTLQGTRCQLPARGAPRFCIRHARLAQSADDQ